MVSGLLIHTGITAAGRDTRQSVAPKIASSVWTPSVGVKAMNMPIDAPSAMA
jgi:hypothetical protein